MPEHKLRFFSIFNGKPEEAIMNHAGYFFGHVTEILSPEKIKERQKYGTIGGEKEFEINEAGIIAHGFTIWSSEPKSTGVPMKVVFNYDQINVSPNIKVGDKVESNIIVSEKGKMEFISVKFKPCA